MKLKTHPILEELWQIKDDLDREAGHNLHRLCENTRQWAKEHAHPGPVVRNAAELRALLAKAEPADSLILREEPPEYGRKKD
jgi:hypothetical protein